MCKKRAQSRSLAFPIFSILCYKNYTIISGGGVGTKYGYENQIVVYEKKGILENPIFQLNTEKDCIDNLRGNNKLGMIIGVAEGKCFIMKIDDKGTLSILHSFVCDESELRTCALDSKAANIYTGGEDRVVRAFEIKTKDDGKLDVSKRYDLKEHTAPITFIDVSVDDELICSCSEDKSCRIYNAKKGIQLKKLTFGEGPKAALNLKISFCFFHKDEKHLLTIQNPDRHGNAYLTMWELEKDCEPVKTIKVHSAPVTTAALDHEGFFLGLGTVDGVSKIVNTRYLEIDNEVQCHDLIVKGVSFLDDSKALGSISPDATYFFLPNVRPEGAFSKFAKLGVVFCIILYIIILLKSTFLD